MWAAEATPSELLQAWAERAYTFRQLVRAMHHAGFSYSACARTVNQCALAGTHDGQEIWNA